MDGRPAPEVQVHHKPFTVRPGVGHRPHKVAMALVNVCYRVPVVAQVDTETGEIDRVVVDDESVSDVEYCETTDECMPLDENHPDAVKAREIAESVMWPRWSFGF